MPYREVEPAPYVRTRVRFRRLFATLLALFGLFVIGGAIATNGGLIGPHRVEIHCAEDRCEVKIRRRLLPDREAQVDVPGFVTLRRRPRLDGSEGARIIAEGTTEVDLGVEVTEAEAQSEWMCFSPPSTNEVRCRDVKMGPWIPDSGYAVFALAVLFVSLRGIDAGIVRITRARRGLDLVETERTLLTRKVRGQWVIAERNLPAG
jgi:hypothetical protein